jgi:hypothetical protein
MKLTPTLALCAMMIMAGVSSGQKINDTPPPSASHTERREKIAADYLDNMVKGDFEASRKDFAKNMADAFSVERQKEKWMELTATAGTFQKVEYTKQELRDGNYEIIKRCHFAEQNVSVITNFNEENQIIGLYYKF